MNINKFISLLTLILFGSILASCGHTGELYLPEKDDVDNAETQESSELDPSAPKTAEEQSASELIDTGDGFDFHNSASDNNSDAGGNPSY